MSQTPAIYRFRLYVAGEGPNSLQARANLHALCSEHLPDRHQIEIVDVVREPRRALEDNVLLTPTLVKLSPEPVRKVIGNLSQTPAILQAFDLRPASQ
ncbi:MAG: circadian clock protein KaiB [Verrucomicrobiaceae bacterium]|nr:circadian clock protein KaiB [Verrucomicrobiaceae bacterium]